MSDSSHTIRFAPGLSAMVLFGFVNLVFFIFPSFLNAGQWEVSPVVVNFDRGAKSQTLTVMNQGDEQETFQITSVEWSQDAAGKDQYTATNDIVFFPKVLIIPPHEQKIIRTGIKAPAIAKEKTYRLFIQEIPPLKKSGEEKGGAQVSIYVKFGVAVYVKPLKEELKGELSGLALNKGVVTATIKNSGNSHLRIDEIAVKGKNDKGDETFVAKGDGANLLSGSSRTFAIPLPGARCAETATLEVVATTEQKLRLSGNLHVDRSQCLP